MQNTDALADRAFEPNGLVEIDSQARAAIRASDDVDELLALKARLHDVAAGRGLWVFGFVLLTLAAVNLTFTVTAAEGSGVSPLVLIVGGIALVISVVAITQAAVARQQARRVDPWLGEIEFRLAQLAARG